MYLSDSVLTLYRLRRAVLHPSLVLSENEEGNNESGNGTVDTNELIRQLMKCEEGSEDGVNIYAQNVLNNLSVKNDEECPICFDVIQEPVLLPMCAHKGYVVYFLSC